MQEDFKNCNNEEENDDVGTGGDEQVNPATDCGIVSIKNAEHSIHILTIIGQVVTVDSGSAALPNLLNNPPLNRER
jgi:hypothetical protein